MAEQSFAEEKKDALKNAEKFLKTDHVGEAIKECIETLLKVISTLEFEISDSSAGSADSALLKRRYDQLKKEFRDIERKFEKFNDRTVPVIAVELKNILTAAVALGAPGAPMKSSAQKIAEALKYAVS